MVFSAFHRFDKYGIAVDFDHYHDIFVVTLKLGWKLAGLVGKNGFSYVVCLDVNVLSFLAFELRTVVYFKCCVLLG